MSTESVSDTFNLLKQSLITFLSQLSSSLISMISNEILINYIKYKSQACNQTLYRAVFLYSKKEVKKLSYAFNKLKRKPKTPSKTQTIKQFFLPQTQTNGQSFIYEDLQRSSSQKKQMSNRKKRIFHNKSQSINCSNRSMLNSNPNITIQNFMERQEKYYQLQNKSKEKIFKDNEEEYNLICTFNPKINKNPNIKNYYTHSKAPAHERLYKDSIQRMNKKEELEKKIANRLKTSRPFDKNKFDQLYEDYKIRKVNQKKLTCQLDEERGYTFTPEISHRNNLSGSASTIRLKNGQSNYNSNIIKEENVNRSVCNNKKDFAFIYDYIRGKHTKENCS